MGKIEEARAILEANDIRPKARGDADLLAEAIRDGALGEEGRVAAIAALSSVELLGDPTSYVVNDGKLRLTWTGSTLDGCGTEAALITGLAGRRCAISVSADMADHDSAAVKLKTILEILAR